jgi:lipopolysaccharide transport system ATP-binding protein
MPNIAIHAEGLSKRYRLGGHEPYRRLGEAITRLATKPFRETQRKERRQILWAIKDMSFAIEEGEIVGVIGSNGAGKTTLLRVLAKITRPTEGRAELYGRVGSLLEVGTGFHNELTGRENVYLNGAILGMTRREITKKYDEIVAFSQIAQFMDTPVKHYSSGQRVRLAFSVAAHLETEILFIDEVLAVGDASFQRKCLGKMGEVANAGRTVLFVSHNMAAITSLCTRVIWAEGGRIRADGDPQELVSAYLSEGYETQGRWEHPEDADCGREIRFRSIEVVGADGSAQPYVPYEEPVRIRVEHEVNEPMKNVMLVMHIGDMSGNVIIATSDVDEDDARTDRRPGVFTHTVTVPAALLRPGRYLISVMAKARKIGSIDDHEYCLGFEVVPRRDMIIRGGIISPLLHWEEESASEPVPAREQLG